MNVPHKVKRTGSPLASVERRHETQPRSPVTSQPQVSPGITLVAGSVIVGERAALLSMLLLALVLLLLMTVLLTDAIACRAARFGRSIEATAAGTRVHRGLRFGDDNAGFALADGDGDLLALEYTI